MVWYAFKNSDIIWIGSSLSSNKYAIQIAGSHILKVLIISPKSIIPYGTEDSGSIVDSVTVVDDYGSVIEPQYGGEYDQGQIIFTSTATPFGSLNLSLTRALWTQAEIDELPPTYETKPYGTFPVAGQEKTQEEAGDDDTDGDVLNEVSSGLSSLSLAKSDFKKHVLPVLQRRSILKPSTPNTSRKSSKKHVTFGNLLVKIITITVAPMRKVNGEIIQSPEPSGRLWQIYLKAKAMGCTKTLTRRT